MCVCVWHRTFEEGPAIDEVPSVGEAWAAGTQLIVVLGTFLRTLVTFWAPGYAHRAAARIDAMLPPNRGRTALVLMGQVAVLRAQV